MLWSLISTPRGSSQCRYNGYKTCKVSVPEYLVCHLLHELMNGFKARRQQGEGNALSDKPFRRRLTALMGNLR